MFDPAQEIAFKQLEDLDASIRLIIVQPNYSSQHLLLDKLLSDVGAIYVRFEGEALSHAELEQQVQSALAEQSATFESGNMTTLVLDECDRADEAGLDTFLSELLLQVSSGRVLVIGRVVPRCVLEGGDLEGVTGFLPTQPEMMYWDYARRADERALLEVRALGLGQIALNGNIVEGWDGVLPRALFYYMVDRGMTTRNDIFETFWPKLSTREATNVFHVTKRKISELLNIDLTVYWSGFYHLSSDIELSYDVALFTERFQNSESAPDEESIELLREALALYKGQFLSELKTPWVLRRREGLHQTYGEALIALARLLDKAGREQEALGLYLQSMAVNAQREDVVRDIIRLYGALGMPADALAAYDYLEAELEQSLGLAPAPELQQLVETIRANLG